jgi:hypothetical protein
MFLITIISVTLVLVSRRLNKEKLLCNTLSYSPSFIVIAITQYRKEENQFTYLAPFACLLIVYQNLPLAPCTPRSIIRTSCIPQWWPVLSGVYETLNIEKFTYAGCWLPKCWPHVLTVWKVLFISRYLLLKRVAGSGRGFCVVRGGWMWRHR